MSSYVEFFLRTKAGMYPIGSYSRSTAMYKVFNDCAPYGRVVPITDTTLHGLRDALQTTKSEWEYEVQSHKAMIKLIPDFNNDIETKIAIIKDYERTIKDCEMELEELEYVGHFLTVLGDMIADVKYIESDSGLAEGVNYNEYIYCGIDVDSDVLRDYGAEGIN